MITAMSFGIGLLLVYFSLVALKSEILIKILNRFQTRLIKAQEEIQVLKGSPTTWETPKQLMRIEADIYTIFIDCKYIAFGLGDYKYGLYGEEAMKIDITFDNNLGIIKDLNRNTIVYRRIPFGSLIKKFVFDAFIRWC